MIIKKETVDGIPVYHVSKNYDDAIMESKMNTFVEKADIKDVIDDDADVYTEDGKLLLRFRKKVIPQEKSEMFYDNIIDFASHISSNRGNAGTEPPTKLRPSSVDFARNSSPPEPLTSSR